MRYILVINIWKKCFEYFFERFYVLKMSNMFFIKGTRIANKFLLNTNIFVKIFLLKNLHKEFF